MRTKEQRSDLRSKGSGGVKKLLELLMAGHRLHLVARFLIRQVEALHLLGIDDNEFDATELMAVASPLTHFARASQARRVVCVPMPGASQVALANRERGCSAWT